MSGEYLRSGATGRFSSSLPLSQSDDLGDDDPRKGYTPGIRVGGAPKWEETAIGGASGRREALKKELTPEERFFAGTDFAMAAGDVPQGALGPNPLDPDTDPQWYQNELNADRIAEEERLSKDAEFQAISDAIAGS
ncbi:hypothetical protein [Pseudonocardia kunmingensis]|uniref:Uncharacterized protein n=1 Tax=Pseudonocardia kunmingensis TaxID=630975 RepID=A0A543DAU8_9PSEU|nr:hypothetical protein [Pseudonocardia kunmingensis]TQM06446.1 hypothetical protein FB558_6702 [Pseudonocardia kunmingensis]